MTKQCGEKYSFSGGGQKCPDARRPQTREEACLDGTWTKRVRRATTQMGIFHHPPKQLTHVESPTKAKAIKKYMGSSFQVKASVGHIKDLPVSKLGVDVENGFTPTYQVIKGKTKIVDEIVTAAKAAKTVYLATDPDREGEAIAWHLAEEISGGGKKKKAGSKKNIYRILLHEITPKAVKEAVAKPGELDKNLFEAQQARRILDRLVG